MEENSETFSCAQIILLSLMNEEIVFQYEPSVKQFLAEKQFQEIKEYIGLPVADYRVVSIGIHPAIAQYNGFYMLDTYNNFYPLSYKHEFRKIIEKELAKNKTIRTYFDEWGGRCYIFTAELGKNYMFTKDSKKRLKNLQLNTAQLKKWAGVIFFLPFQLTMRLKIAYCWRKCLHQRNRHGTFICIKLNKARTAPLISKRGAALFLRNDVKRETFE